MFTLFILVQIQKKTKKNNRTMDEDYNAPDIIGDVLFSEATADVLDISAITLDDLYTGG